MVVGGGPKSDIPGIPMCFAIDWRANHSNRLILELCTDVRMQALHIHYSSDCIEQFTMQYGHKEHMGSHATTKIVNEKKKMNLLMKKYEIILFFLLCVS